MKYCRLIPILPNAQTDLAKIFKEDKFSYAEEGPHP